MAADNSQDSSDERCDEGHNRPFSPFSQTPAASQLDPQALQGKSRDGGQIQSSNFHACDLQGVVNEMKGMQSPLFIELCSGCGILSATVASAGFHTMAVDHDHNKHVTKIKTFSLDLTKRESWTTLEHIVQNCQVIGVHIAPPCGTCSRAREIKLSSFWHGPQPLRDKSHPYGVPDMSQKDRHRVEQANAIYMHMANFCVFLNAIQIPWTIENPTNSWLWELPCMEPLVETSYFASFHSCAYGGLRHKATSFLTNHPAFLTFCKECDGSHQHLPWGYDETTKQFSTALEAEYPRPLCEEYARVLVDIATANNISVNAFPKAEDKLHPQKQNAGRSVPLLIPEYERVVSVLLETGPSLDSKNRLAHDLPNIPAGSKLLRSEAKGGSGTRQFTMYVFGIFHGHKRFVNIAKSLWHPFDELKHIPDLMVQSIFDMLSSSKLEVARRRLVTLTKWRQWAAELKDEEDNLKEHMPEHVRRILQHKRPVLLRKLAETELDWPDARLCDDLCNGFRITGAAPATGVFRQQPKPATLTEEELMEQSKFLRPAIIGKAKSSSDDRFAAELFEITKKEAAEKGWLDGPLSHDEVTERVGRQWLPVRRFCVEQKGKIRPIDDFCENKLNSTFTTVDKISLKTMDHIVWTALTIFKFCLHQGHMHFNLKNGVELRAAVHADWKGDSAMRATALDLKSACKQLPLNKQDANKTVVTLRDPQDGQVKFFIMHTLPFGSSASVLHFNRISWLLWALGCRLGLLWSCYYDDYPILCPKDLESSSMGAAKAMFKLTVLVQ